MLTDADFWNPVNDGNIVKNAGKRVTQQNADTNQNDGMIPFHLVGVLKRLNREVSGELVAEVIPDGDADERVNNAFLVHGSEGTD